MREGARAQHFPMDGDTLNFTSVCFSFPWQAKAVRYTVLLTDGVEPGVPARYAGVGNKIVVNGLKSGHSYVWTVVSESEKGEVLETSPARRFFVAPYTNRIRYLFGVNDKENRTNDLLIMDYTHSAIDRDGQTVWYLPGLIPSANIRDLKMTDDGTVTAILDSNALEMDLRGHILWKAPDDGRVSRGRRENYHHTFTKLSTGNYLVLGSEFCRYRLPGQTDSISVEMGTVIEYSPDKTIRWVWHARDFFKPEWIPFRRRYDGQYSASLHLNAVSTDGVYIYAGFRDMGWIVKIDKAGKNVVALYGGQDSKEPYHYAQRLFRYQHDVFLLRDGSIGVVNNDSVADPAVVSGVVVFSQGKTGTPIGTKLFEFPFNYSGTIDGKSPKLGNLTELPNGNLLVNMGAINRVFEVTRDKKVVWEVRVDQFDAFKNVWQFFPQYRVAPVSSLYPNEFCLKVENAEWSNGAWQATCFLVNVGSETNAYTFWAENETTRTEVAHTSVLAPGQSLRQKIRIPKRPNGPYTALVVQVTGKSKKERVDL